MAYSNFDKLKAFFFELKETKFHPEKMRSRFSMNGEPVIVNRVECFNLLREKIPDLRGKDDAYLIKYLSNPNNIKNRILAEFAAEERIELEKTLEEKPGGAEVVGEQASTAVAPAEQGLPAQAPAGEAAGTMGGPGLPTAPSISFGRGRVIRNIPRTPEVPQTPKPEISIANKSGTIVKGPGAETPPSKIFIANKSGAVVGEHTIASSAAKNVGSATQIGIKRGLTKVGGGLSRFLSGAGRAGGDMLGGAIGGGGRALGNFGLKTVDFGARFSNAVSTRGSALATAGRGGTRWAVIGLLGFFLLTGLLAAFGPPLPGQQQPTAVAGPTGNNTLGYNIPFRDKSVTAQNPDAVKNEVKQRWPNAQLQNWDTIVSQSIANGWNPAFVLALWIEESGAQGEPVYDDALGCAPFQPTHDVNLSLKCLFNNFPISKYPNDKFADFMCMYSESKLSPCTFITNPNFPPNIKTWYSKLVPSGAGALTVVTPVTPITNPPGNFVYYCQKDSKWSGTSYACETIGYAGCGPTSLAMVLSTFGINYNPIQAAKILTDNGYAVCRQGTAIESALQNKSFLSSIGLIAGNAITKGGSLDLQLAKDYINKGYLIIGSSDRYPLCNCGHIFVVQQVDPVKQTVYIRDPINCSSQAGGENTTNREYAVSAFTWKYAYPVIKKP